MSFARYLDKNSIRDLKTEQLFNECLKKDCEEGNVFPTIRKNKVDFYHNGGNLFSWEKGKRFSTHNKFASVIYNENKNGYVTETEIKNRDVYLINNFCMGYERIKENCTLYSGLESSGVSKLYHGFSCAASKRHDVYVLDIEIAFANYDSNGKKTPSDRIDFVAIDKFGKLRFFEAKHYSNRAPLLCPDENTPPPLYAQLEKYDWYLKQFGAAVLESYIKHVNVIMTLFGVNIPMPERIDPMTRAIIFGFDTEQQQYLNKNIMQARDQKTQTYWLKNRTYTIGNTANADLPTLFRGGGQNWA